MPYWTTLVRFNRFISLAEIFIHLNQCEIEISVNRQHGGFVPILWQEQHERRGPFRDTYGKLGRLGRLQFFPLSVNVISLKILLAYLSD